MYFDGYQRALMALRLQTKQKENEKKPPLRSPDVLDVRAYEFSLLRDEEAAGDSGSLFLAVKKGCPHEQLLVKHAFTDCACNEFVYTKLLQGMGYHMPDAFLFQFPSDRSSWNFDTEYVLGQQYLDLSDPAPNYKKIREAASNWREYFGFLALYAIFKESDGAEIVLTRDHLIYRIDTTDAFPISNRHLDCAGISLTVDGVNSEDAIKHQLFSYPFDTALDCSLCNWILKDCLKLNPDCLSDFLDPFQRLQDISDSYIDGFLTTLCYFYPDYIGDFFRKYLSEIKKQAFRYWRDRRGGLT